MFCFSHSLERGTRRRLPDVPHSSSYHGLNTQSLPRPPKNHHREQSDSRSRERWETVQKFVWSTYILQIFPFFLATLVMMIMLNFDNFVKFFDFVEFCQFFWFWWIFKFCRVWLFLARLLSRFCIFYAKYLPEIKQCRQIWSTIP